MTWNMVRNLCWCGTCFTLRQAHFSRYADKTVQDNESITGDCPAQSNFDVYSTEPVKLCVSIWRGLRLLLRRSLHNSYSPTHNAFSVIHLNSRATYIGYDTVEKKPDKHQNVLPHLVKLLNDDQAAQTLGIIHIRNKSLYISSEEDVLLISQTGREFVNNNHSSSFLPPNAFYRLSRLVLMNFTQANWSKIKRGSRPCSDSWHKTFANKNIRLLDWISIHQYYMSLRLRRNWKTEEAKETDLDMGEASLAEGWRHFGSGRSTSYEQEALYEDTHKYPTRKKSLGNKRDSNAAQQVKIVIQNGMNLSSPQKKKATTKEEISSRKISTVNAKKSSGVRHSQLYTKKLQQLPLQPYILLIKMTEEAMKTLKDIL